MAATCGLISPIWVWFSVFELDNYLHFSILVGRAVFPFVNICFFIARKSVSGFP